VDVAVLELVGPPPTAPVPVPPVPEPPVPPAPPLALVLLGVEPPSDEVAAPPWPAPSEVVAPAWRAPPGPGARPRRRRVVVIEAAIALACSEDEAGPEGDGHGFGRKGSHRTGVTARRCATFLRSTHALEKVKAVLALDDVREGVQVEVVGGREGKERAVPGEGDEAIVMAAVGLV